MKRLRDILIFIAAVWLLFSCSEDKGRMLRQLEMLEEANRADSVMKNDSLAENLVEYFDKHGTSNERMRAKYMLGRTYYDLGELPRALETYLEAANCADTTASDCDFKVLSRIHAQSANIYNDQIQPQSQLTELRKAEYYARRGKDTLMAVECYAEQSYAYQILNNKDSVILVEETAAQMFHEMHKEERYAQSLGGAITSLVEKGDLKKAKDYALIYERSSGFFDKDGNIKKGREMYYYAKGKYYLAANHVDSAEMMFRKLMGNPSLNRRIAGSKGLQQIFERKGNSDSIAKYANLGYNLNDSAYSLSEMQNIQRMKASYNYAHHKLTAEQQKLKATRSFILFMSLLFLVIVLAIVITPKYRKLQKIALDFRLKNSAITLRFRKMARSNPPIIPTYSEWAEIRRLVEKEIPSFHERLKSQPNILEDIDYDICILIRVFMSPIEISKLTQCSPSNVSNIRKRLLKRVFEKEGGSDDFDDEIRKIY